MNGWPFGSSPQPSSGPIGSWINNPEPNGTQFFLNQGPITKNSKYVGFNWAGVRGPGDNVPPKYINSMFGSAPGPLDPDAEASRTSRVVTPDGFLTTGASIRFLNLTTQEQSGVYIIDKAARILA